MLVVNLLVPVHLSLAYDKKFLLGAAFLTEMDGFIFCLQNVYQHI